MKSHSNRRFNHNSNKPWCILLAMVVLMAGCKSPETRTDRGYVNSEITWRTNHSISCENQTGEVMLPPGIVVSDGLTEEEAVAVALWNNQTFLSTLSNLGIARGDLVQAGLLTNPQLNLLFPPIGSKQLEWTLFVPLEAIILRKHRIEIAERDFQRIAIELVQNGLNVARDTRVAYADLVLAQESYEFAQEAVRIRSGLADLAKKRLEAGDIGELEAITARIDADRGRTDEQGLKHAVDFAEATLKNVMGIASLNVQVSVETAEKPIRLAVDAESLIQEAIEIRPDIKAARISMQAAQKRIELAKKSFLRIDAIGDGNHGGEGPSNVGPGLRFEIPIFNRNQGIIIRSEWTLDQANHNYYAVRDQVITDVRTAHATLLQTQESLFILRQDVLPALEESVQLAEASYRDGAETYLFVLQSLSQFLDARVQEIQLEASLRKAIAELDRGVGKRVVSQNLELAELPPLNELETRNEDILIDDNTASEMQLVDLESELNELRLHDLEEEAFSEWNALPPIIEFPAR